MARYKDDPHWITCRYTTECVKCGEMMTKGTRAFFYPRTRSMYCDSVNCGQSADADFESMRFDEESGAF